MVDKDDLYPEAGVMPPRPRRLDPAVPIERFALALRDLHRNGGKPKQQQLGTAMHCSHATVSAILNGHRFPSWPQTEAFVRACGGDVHTWRSKWATVDREINTEGPTILGGIQTLSTVMPSIQHLTGRDFFASLVAQVRQSRRRILATYMRMTPTVYFEGFTDQETGRAAAEYFTEVLQWANRPGPRSVRRVICLPNTEVLEWAQELHTQTKNLARYEVRVLDWRITTDPVNIVIFDDVSAFLTFDLGTIPGASGFKVDDPEFVRGATGYFCRLWSSSTPLAENLLDPPAK